MKTKYILILVAAVALLTQACGSKSKADEKRKIIADSIAAVQKADSIKAATDKAANDALAERKRAASERRAKESYDVAGVTVYNRTEVKPQFKGGQDAMNKYFKDNLKYPGGDTKWEGTVFVEFVVAGDGKVEFAEVMEDTDPTVDQSFKDEALRVVMGMPAWIPAKQHGKAVPVSYTLPIRFQLL